jgi:hypothetical protein
MIRTCRDFPQRHVRQRDASAEQPLGFLIYPQAETAGGRLDSLDPDNFKYEITSVETSATNA